MSREEDREQLIQQALRQTEQNQWLQQLKDLTLKELTSAEIANVAQANPANIQEVAASQLAIINRYYESVLQQAQHSFRLALTAAGIGLLFFLAAVSFLLLQQPDNLSNVSLISGALIEAISAINFYLYGRASNQLASFHTRLDRTQLFLLANSVCENLEGEVKLSTRAELVRTIANSQVISSAEKTQKPHSKE